MLRWYSSILYIWPRSNENFRNTIILVLYSFSICYVSIVLVQEKKLNIIIILFSIATKVLQNHSTKALFYLLSFSSVLRFEQNMVPLQIEKLKQCQLHWKIYCYSISNILLHYKFSKHQRNKQKKKFKLTYHFLRLFKNIPIV